MPTTPSDTHPLPFDSNVRQKIGGYIPQHYDAMTEFAGLRWFHTSTLGWVADVPCVAISVRFYRDHWEPGLHATREDAMRAAIRDKLSYARYLLNEAHARRAQLIRAVTELELAAKDAPA